MGAGASVGQLSELPEEEVVAHLTALYQQDPEKIERIFSTASSKAKVSKEAAPPTEEKAAEEPAAEAPKAPEPEPAPEEEKPKEDPKPSAAPEEAPTAAGTTHEERSEKAAEPEAPVAVAPPAPAPAPAPAPVSDDTISPQQLLDIINSVRANPQTFVPHMEERLTRFDGNKLKSKVKNQPNIMTIEGPAAVHEAIKFLQSAVPLAPLSLSEGLCKAAADHLNDIGPKGLATHVGSDGSSMQDRIERHGDWKDVIGENLDFGNRAALDIILSLLVDDNVASRGHRKNIMNEKFKTVGIAWGTHSRYRYACVLDFAGGFGPKVLRLKEAVKIADASTLDANVQAVLDSIPFDDVKLQVHAALTSEEKHTVDLDYKPGEIEIRIKNDKGCTVLNGTWQVQHQS